MNSGKTELLKVPVSFHKSEVHCLIIMPLDSKLVGRGRSSAVGCLASLCKALSSISSTSNTKQNKLDNNIDAHNGTPEKEFLPWSSPNNSLHV